MNSKALKSLCLAVSTIIICCFSFSASAVVKIKAPVADTLMTLNSGISTQSPEALKESKGIVKGWKARKGMKRVKRLFKRFFKKNNSFGGIFSSPKFRLGAVFLLVGILAGLVFSIFALPQIFGWLAGVVATAGLVLMIWGLIEHSGII